MTFTYIDGIFLGVIILLTLIGVFRGFLRTVLAFCGTLVKLVIAFFLSKPIAALVSSWTKIDDRLRLRFYDWAAGLSDQFTVNLVGMNEQELGNQISSALSDANFPRILRGVFGNIFQITPDAIAGKEVVTIADMVSISLTQFVLVVCSFVAIFLILFAVIFVLKRIAKTIFERNRFFFKADRVLGGIVGFVEGLFICLVLLSLISIFKNSDLFSGFFSTLDKSVITKPVSDFAFGIIDKYFDFGGFLTKSLKK